MQPPTGIVLGYEPKDRFVNPLSFWLDRPEESKAKNDLLQLPNTLANVLETRIWAISIACQNAAQGMTLRHSLFKYYDQRIWAEKFLDGEMLFRSLAYFRDSEDAIRGDEYEGTSRFLPDGGLQITNQTQRTQFTLAEYAFESTVKANEIFVFCASRRLGDDLANEFNAAVAVEITRIPTFCERIRAALPPTAIFRARRVDYYPQSQGGNPRWALPDTIATSKLEKWASQEETRFIFSLTDALMFENVRCQLSRRRTRTPAKPEEHLSQVLKVGSLRDICRLREFSK